MFNSGISVKELIDELISEVDIALDIPNATYVQWLNALQQILYTEVIKEQRETFIPTSGSVNFELSLSQLNKNENENNPIFEDIISISVFGGSKMQERQLIKSTVASGRIFPFTYYKENNDISYNLELSFLGKLFVIVHIVRPALIDKETLEGNVMIPIEFIDLVKAKLRGEAYKLANEEDLAAKWLNDYNILLENFKMWIAEKAPNFGL